tara:strand:+ start:1411 stop:1965 length:555 start_codon:yes stop_codon:yes gene_type:complete
LFAEISAILGILNSVNAGLNTLRETGGNVEQAVGILDKFQDANQRLDKWERKKKTRKPLSQADSIKLATSRAKAAQARQALADHFRMLPGGQKIYQDAMRLMEKSQREHTAYLKEIGKKRAERRKKMQAISASAFITVSFIFLAWAGWFLHGEYQDAQLKSAIKKLEYAKERQRNIRKCGRPKC